MKKTIMVVILMCIIIFHAFSEDSPIHSYVSVKLGYGSETGGIGGALEAKYSFFGIYGGLGWFGDLGYSVGAKLYFDGSDNMAFYAGVGYGLIALSRQYSYSSSSGLSTSSAGVNGVYGMGGITFVGDSGFFWDLGFGYGDSADYGGMLVMNASIGYAF